MVARGRCLEKSKRTYLAQLQNVAYSSYAAFQQRYQRHEDARRRNKEDKGRIGRVDRNKRSDITRDKAQRAVLEKLRSKRNKEWRDPKITAREERKDSCRGVEKRASRRSRRRCRLGWLLSREQNCGCLSNPTDRNSISSCVSHLPRCVLSLFTTGYRRLALLSLLCSSL